MSIVRFLTLFQFTPKFQCATSSLTWHRWQSGILARQQLPQQAASQTDQYWADAAAAAAVAGHHRGPRALEMPRSVGDCVSYRTQASAAV